MMEDKHTIAYKTWLENLHEPPPETVWEAVADQLDIDQTWESISETLDLDDVWNQVEENLPQGIAIGQPVVPAKHRKLSWIVAAIVLLTLTTPVLDEIAHENNANAWKTEKNVVHGATDVTDSKEPALQAPQQIPLTKDLASKKTESSTGTEQYRVDKKARLADGPTVQHSVRSKQHVPHESLLEMPIQKTSLDQEPGLRGLIEQQQAPTIAVPKIVTVQQPTGMDSAMLLMETVSVDRIVNVQLQTDSVHEVDQQRKPRWQIGLMGAVKNTWLVNPETTNGLKRSSLSNTKVTWGKEFGATVQRQVGHTSFVQVEYYFYSEIGQRYQEYIDVLYQTKDIKLRYQKLQFVYRTQVLEKYKLPPLFFAVGLHVSKLSLASTSVGGEGQLVTEEYMPWDYGVLTGIETEISLTDRLVLVPGIRAAYGIRNIYGGSSQSPADFNKTHTASIGISLGMKYSVGKATAGQ